MRHHLTLLAGLLVLASTGCIGKIRDTTTARTSTEILLVSTAAERAVVRFDAAPLKGKRVYVNDALFESIDKNYVLAALGDHLAGAGATLSGKADPADTDVVLEIRNGALGIWDGDFNLGIPPLPISAQGVPPIMSPNLALFRRLSQQGYAKLQLWAYEAKSGKLIGASPDLWGHSYYNTWWVFGIGPFDGSNDCYLDGWESYMPGGDSAN